MFIYLFDKNNPSPLQPKFFLTRDAFSFFSLLSLSTVLNDHFLALYSSLCCFKTPHYILLVDIEETLFSDTILFLNMALISPVSWQQCLEQYDYGFIRKLVFTENIKCFCCCCSVFIHMPLGHTASILNIVLS